MAQSSETIITVTPTTGVTSTRITPKITLFCKCRLFDFAKIIRKSIKYDKGIGNEMEYDGHLRYDCLTPPDFKNEEIFHYALQMKAVKWLCDFFKYDQLIPRGIILSKYEYDHLIRITEILAKESRLKLSLEAERHHSLIMRLHDIRHSQRIEKIAPGK